MADSKDEPAPADSEDEAEAVTGGCLCGAVRYEARAYLKNAHFCHCRLCQRSSGGPATISVSVEAGSLRFTEGEPRYYQSSGFAERGFCPTCGSRLLWKHVGDEHPDWTNLDIGCLDNPERVVPIEHFCVESRLPWYRANEDLRQLRSEDLPGLVEAWEKTER